jgi:hypothetical protein
MGAAVAAEDEDALAAGRSNRDGVGRHPQLCRHLLAVLEARIGVRPDARLQWDVAEVAQREPVLGQPVEETQAPEIVGRLGHADVAIAGELSAERARHADDRDGLVHRPGCRDWRGFGVSP